MGGQYLDPSKGYPGTQCLKITIDKSSLGSKSLPKIARQTLRGRHPNNPNIILIF